MARWRKSYRRRTRVSPVPVSLVLLVILCACMFVLIERNIRPTLMAILDAQITSQATEYINQAVNENIGQVVEYRQLFHIEKDREGNIALLQQNTTEVNRVKSTTTLAVQEKLNQLSDYQIRIPMGQILGSNWLASVGPKLSVTVMPIGTVQTDVLEVFEEAGINQTRHVIYLKTAVRIRVVVPLMKTSVTVTSLHPIAQAVIVGKVPNAYFNFGTGGMMRLWTPEEIKGLTPEGGR